MTMDLSKQPWFNDAAGDRTSDYQVFDVWHGVKLQPASSVGAEGGAVRGASFGVDDTMIELIVPLDDSLMANGGCTNANGVQCPGFGAVCVL
jgi:hypothetical protein